MRILRGNQALWTLVACGALLALPLSCKEDTEDDNNSAKGTGGEAGEETTTSGGTPSTGGGGGADDGGTGNEGGNGGSGPTVEDPCGDIDSRPEIEVSGEITDDTTWECTNIYVLTEPVIVTGESVDSPATLTIEPGTVVRGVEGGTLENPADPGALVITTTGRIEAEGTAEQPIVFTSNDTSNRDRGSWGGVVLAGTGTVNTADGIDDLEGTRDRQYGGGSSPNDEHDCGTLRYVRIEFAGFTMSEGKELNGLGVAGCGSETELEYIQIHMPSDDGIEFWGGTADLKHAVITGASDDSLDWDQGWRGRVQFVVIQQHDDEADQGVEADGYASVSSPIDPVSSPTLFNVTMLGRGAGHNGLHLKEGTQLLMRNSVIVDFPTGLINIDNAETADWLETDDLTVQNTTFVGQWPTEPVYGSANVGAGGAGGGNAGGAGGALPVGTQYIEGDWFITGDGNPGNVVASAFSDILPNGALSETSPEWVPASASPLADDAVTPPDDGFFDTSATYRGAFEPGGEDWTAGWTSYPED